MGFKCSVLGHRFEEPGIVHEREQRGDEVIVIKRKVRLCTLCGEQRVLAESKEITKQIDDDGDDVTGDSNDSPATTTDALSASTETNERGEDESSTGHATSESDPKRTETETETETGTESGFGAIDRVGDDTAFADDRGSAMVDLRGTDDDGVILSDEDTGREYGEWPDEASETAIDTSWDPDTMETPPRSTDAGSSSVARTSSALPVDAPNDGEIIGQTDEPAEKPVGGKSLSCQNCDFSVIASDSPFRSGDICPGCHESYLSDGG